MPPKNPEPEIDPEPELKTPDPEPELAPDPEPEAAPTSVFPPFGEGMDENDKARRTPAAPAE